MIHFDENEQDFFLDLTYFSLCAVRVSISSKEFKPVNDDLPLLLD